MWQWCVIGGVIVIVVCVVTVDARRRRCRASFVTWHSCATGFSSANVKDGGGGILTLGPGDVPSWEGGGGKEGSDVATGFRIWDDVPNQKVGISSISSCC